MKWYVCFVTESGLKLFYKPPTGDQIEVGFVMDLKQATAYIAALDAEAVALRLATKYVTYLGKLGVYPESECRQDLRKFTINDLDCGPEVRLNFNAYPIRPE